MLNPKLKEIYSPHVIECLKPLADYAEQHNMDCGLSGVSEQEGIKAPSVVTTKTISEEFEQLVFEAFFPYVKDLPDRVSDMLYLSYLDSKELEELNWDKEVISIWVG